MGITTRSQRGKEKYEILICMPNPSPRYNSIFVSCQAKLLWLDPPPNKMLNGWSVMLDLNKLN
jgi:hypothetical protein